MAKRRLSSAPKICLATRSRGRVHKAEGLGGEPERPWWADTIGSVTSYEFVDGQVGVGSPPDLDKLQIGAARARAANAPGSREAIFRLSDLRPIHRHLNCALQHCDFAWNAAIPRVIVLKSLR